MQTNLDQATEFILSKFKSKAKTAIILGSGLGSITDDMQNKIEISSEDIPHFPNSTVAGHDGKILYGLINNCPIIVLKGRTHLYEGYSPEEVIFVIRLFHRIGIQSLIVTNSAGGTNSTFKPGDLMIISDHINLMFRNPLIGPNDTQIGSRFPDMSGPYDFEYIKLAKQTALELKINIKQGVYCSVLGPSYETAAEVKMIKLLGADAIGMSTVPDVIAARHAGIRVLGLSCITNLGTGLSNQTLTHEEVTTIANAASKQFKSLVMAIIPKL